MDWSKSSLTKTRLSFKACISSHIIHSTATNYLSTALTPPQENVQQHNKQWSCESCSLGLALKGLWKQPVGNRTEMRQRDWTMHMNQAWTLSLTSLEICLSAYTWAQQTLFFHYHWKDTSLPWNFELNALFFSLCRQTQSPISISCNRKVCIHDLRVKPHTEPHHTQSVTLTEMFQTWCS